MELEPTFNGISMCADEGYQIPLLRSARWFDRMFGFFKEPILHFIDHVVKDIPCLVS